MKKICKTLLEKIKSLNLTCSTIITLLVLSAVVGYLSIYGYLDALDLNGPFELSVEVLETVNDQAIPNHEVWITKASLGGETDLKVLFSESASNGFEFRTADEYGYSSDVITSVGGVGSTITFYWDASEEDNVEFWKQNFSGMIKLTLLRDGIVLEESKIDLYTNEANEFVHYVPNTSLGETSHRFTFLKYIVSVITGLLAALALTLMMALLGKTNEFFHERFPGIFDKKEVSLQKMSEEAKKENGEKPIDKALSEKPSSLKDFFSHLKLKTTIAILSMAVMLACTTHSWVNRRVNDFIRLLPKKEVIITVVESEHPGTDVWINESSQDMDLFEACVEGEKKGIWEYRDAKEWSYSANTLVSYGDNIGSSISIKSPVSPDSGILFWVHEYCGAISVSADGIDPIVYDLFSDTGGTKTIYPFSKSILPVILRIVIYVVETVFAYFSFVLVLYWLISRKKRSWARRAHRIIEKNYFVVLWGLLYCFAVAQYLCGIPNYLEFGDQVYYWGLDLFANGGWDTTYTAALIASFRGYWCNLFPSISRAIGRVTSVDPVLVYLLFTSVALSWLSSYVIPEIYKLLTKRNASLLQKNTFLLVYLFFWNGYLTAVLADMFGAVAFLTGTMYALRFFFGKRRLLSSTGAGIFWAIACNFRTAYQYGIYVLIIGAILIKLYLYFKSRKKIKAVERAVIMRQTAKVSAGILLFVIAFVLISYPQHLINMEKGNAGFLPFDFEGAWADFNGDPSSVLLWSANQSLLTYSGYPYPVFDSQMISIKPQLYAQDAVLTLPQILNVYLNDPLETLVMVAKKLFVAFDIKTNVSYPTVNLWRETPGLLFSLLNYLVLGSALYVFFSKEEVNRREKVMFLLLAAGLTLPQMFVHVEWRYVLSTYIMLYMFFSYHFVGELLADSDKTSALTESSYPQFITLFVILSFMLSLSIYA